jgi:hypothetical protein
MEFKMGSRNFKRQVYKKFDDLFKDKNDIQYCMDVLRIAIPAVINESGEYLLKSKKGPVVAWKNVLVNRGYIHDVNDQTAADLLNLKFKNLNIREVSFRSDQSRVYEEFQLQFQQNINPKWFSR